MGQTRAELVADQIRASLLSGVYISGERLVELALARQLEVSQNTIRDALYRLEQDGWVVKRSRHGVFVRPFTRGQAEELFQLLGALEPLALDNLLREKAGMSARAWSRAVQPLADCVAEARRAFNVGEWQHSIERLFQFHEVLAQRPDRELTHRLIAQLYNGVRLLEALRQVRAPRNSRELDLAISRHEAMISFLNMGEGDKARHALDEQVSSYTDLIIGALELGETDRTLSQDHFDD